MNKKKPICHYDVHCTFYGFDDNDDGEGNYGTAAIAYPHIHKLATEDVGDHRFPSTFATDVRFIKPGSIIYVPRIQKYYIMEDGCVECSQDWDKKKRIKHIDLYIGGQERGGLKLIARENQLDIGRLEIVIVNPPNNLPVDYTPLFMIGSK